mgnify:CR=1 FL=1
MAQFSVNATRFDPYKNFKFRLRWDGRFVAGVSKVSALKRTTEVVKHRQGGDGDSGGITRHPPRPRDLAQTAKNQFSKESRRHWASQFGSYQAIPAAPSWSQRESSSQTLRKHRACGIHDSKTLEHHIWRSATWG